MIVIDTSVWIPLLNGTAHPKAELARELIEGPEDIGVPGIVLEEILRGLRTDSQFRRVRDHLLGDFTYLEMRQSVFLLSAEIYRALRKRGKRSAVRGIASSLHVPSKSRRRSWRTTPTSERLPNCFP